MEIRRKRYTYVEKVRFPYPLLGIPAKKPLVHWSRTPVIPAAAIPPKTQKHV